MSLRKPLVLVAGRPTELGATDTIAGELSLIGTATVGQSALITAGITVMRYSVTFAGLAVTDRIIATLNGVPSNGSLQDAYVSAVNTISVGVLIPVLGVAATVAVPIAFYRIN